MFVLNWTSQGVRLKIEAMAEHSHEGEKNNLNVGDIVSAIRSGKLESVQQQHEATDSPKPQQPKGRPTAGFWVQNLRESVERRMDQVYESIQENPSAMSAMERRGLQAADQISVPLESATGFVEMTPGEKPPPLKNPNHPGSDEVLDFSDQGWVVEEVRSAAPKRAKKLQVNPLIRKMFERDSD